MAPGSSHHWPQGDNLNKLGIGPLGDANHLNNFKEGHIRIIPTKFGQNPASSLGDVL